MRDQEKGIGLIRSFATIVAIILLAGVAQAFTEIPKESAKALGVTRGKPFSSGAVFVNGKYLEPPYVVERWGTGLRINGKQVSGPLVDWNEFLKTQSGVKTVKTEIPAPVVETAPAPTYSTSDSDDTSLDDLFDDDPKPKKKTYGRSRPTAPAKPRVSVSYALDGDFVQNDASKALLARVNSARTDIDRHLRKGGFVCFGNNYSQVVGDDRSLSTMLEKLPELLQNSADAKAFNAGIRSAGLVYLNEVLCADMYRNRIDYRKLKELREKLKKDSQWKRMLDDIHVPTF